jgi:hypothetical protein
MWKTPKAEQAAEVVTCSLTKPAKIIMDALAKQKIEILMREYPHQEWMSYMVGVLEPEVRVKDLVIPPHAHASGGSAEAEPMHVPADCLGVLHSHHHMGAFHSGTDDAYVDRNYPLSITVAIGAQGLDFDAIMWQHTPCGKLFKSKCSMSFIYPPAADLSDFLTEAKTNIQKGVPHRTTTFGGMPLSEEEVISKSIRNETRHREKSGRLWPINETEDCGAGYWYKGSYITKEEYDKIMASIWKDGNK